MIRVIICSPYRGETERNVTYARRCVRDSFDRGEAPFASHLIYPQILKDDVEEERLRGFQAEYEWISTADFVAFYIDYGWTTGMMKELKIVRLFSRKHATRKIGPNQGVKP